MKQPNYIYTLDRSLFNKHIENFMLRNFKGRYRLYKEKLYIEFSDDYNNLVVYIKIINPNSSLSSCNGCGKTKGCC